MINHLGNNEYNDYYCKTIINDAITRINVISNFKIQGVQLRYSFSHNATLNFIVILHYGKMEHFYIDIDKNYFI